ncbi:unnamed protein product [Bathycoccus prasinos]
MDVSLSSLRTTDDGTSTKSPVPTFEYKDVLKLISLNINGRGDNVISLCLYKVFLSMRSET